MPTYYALHCQEVLARAKARYVADPEYRARVKAQALAHYSAHRDQRLAKAKADYRQDPAKFQTRIRLGQAQKLADYTKRPERFQAEYRVDVDGCWRWTGTRTVAGYGIAGSTRAYRTAWQLSNGSIPVGYEIHHLCHVTACVNPSHLVAIPADEHRKRHAKLRRQTPTLTKAA